MPVDSLWLSNGNQAPPDQGVDFYDKTAYPWVANLESQWRVIQAEFFSVLQKKNECLNPYKDITKSNTKDGWKTAGILYWTFPSDRYISIFPKTWEILQSVPNVTSVSFLSLNPYTTIKPHFGDTNAIIRCHLGLSIPACAPSCGFRVNNTTISWEEGKIFLFDDAQIHTAWNNTSEVRYILSFDVLKDEYQHRKNEISCKVLANILCELKFKNVRFFNLILRFSLLKKFFKVLSFLYFRCLLFSNRSLGSMF